MAVLHASIVIRAGVPRSNTDTFARTKNHSRLRVSSQRWAQFYSWTKWALRSRDNRTFASVHVTKNSHASTEKRAQPLKLDMLLSTLQRGRIICKCADHSIQNRYPQDQQNPYIAGVLWLTLNRTVLLYCVYKRELKLNSWTFTFVEVSGHNLEISQTWGFPIRCLHYKPVSNQSCSWGETISRGDCA
jgi:hypothetical protein